MEESTPTKLDFTKLDAATRDVASKEWWNRATRDDIGGALDAAHRLVGSQEQMFISPEDGARYMDRAKPLFDDLERGCQDRFGIGVWEHVRGDDRPKDPGELRAAVRDPQWWDRATPRDVKHALGVSFGEHGTQRERGKLLNELNKGSVERHGVKAHQFANGITPDDVNRAQLRQQTVQAPRQSGPPVMEARSPDIGR